MIPEKTNSNEFTYVGLDTNFDHASHTYNSLIDAESYYNKIYNGKENITSSFNTNYSSLPSNLNKKV
jgi:hypothetical protein